MDASVVLGMSAAGAVWAALGRPAPYIRLFVVVGISVLWLAVFCASAAADLPAALFSMFPLAAGLNAVVMAAVLLAFRYRGYRFIRARQEPASATPSG